MHANEINRFAVSFVSHERMPMLMCKCMLIFVCIGLFHYLHRAHTHTTENAEYIDAVRSVYTKKTTCTLNSIVECIFMNARLSVYTKHKTV